MSDWVSNVKKFVDGTDRLNAADINPVVTTLANRDQYLFEQLNSYSDKTILLSYNQPIAENTVAGTPVYFDTSSGQAVLRGAKGSFLNSTTSGHLSPAESSYVFGLVKQIYAGSSSPVVYGDVYVRGLIEDPDIDFNTLLDTASVSEGTLVPGPLYLSSEEAGKLTIFPSGASVFVGYYIGGNSFILAPNIDSLNQLYFNYKVYLRAEAAGTPDQNVDDTWTIVDNDITNLGWITAAAATSELGITPPTNALFYYNVPTNAEIADLLDNDTITAQEASDALLLKKALPAHPSNYTLLFVNGVLQTAYDSGHTNGSYIIDDNGIWWVDNETNYVPWGEGLVQQLFITKLNPNYGASIVTSLTSINDAIAIIDKNGLTTETGDLRLKLNLNIVPNANSVGNGTTVQSLSFDPVTGDLTSNNSPVVNSITVGPGLKASTSTGSVVLSLSNFSLSGEVSDIEPEEAEFVYKGLHSYLRVKRPQPNQKIGFVGKIKVPEAIPANTNLYIKLDCFADSSTSSSNTQASFVFEYATSQTGTSMSTAITSSNVVIPSSNLPLLTQTTVYKDGSNVPYFTIPSSKFTAGSYINFRIARTYDTSYTYPNPVGIVGVSWVIE
jgi:hypothetical protein